jgi:glutamate-1-semialdehyde aminotransferase
VSAVREQVARGITLLPTEDASGWARNFKALPPYYWQFLSATDANRFPFGSPSDYRCGKILVFNWCYHGSVDETFITLKMISKPRRGNVGPPVDP